MTGRWKLVAALGVLVLAGAGAAIAPVAYGQSRAPKDPHTRVRAVQMISGQGRLGVSLSDVEESDAAKNKLASNGGVIVEDVLADSPAEKGGVKKGDIIVEFDGEKIRGSRQFTRIVQETPSGRKVQATVIRDGQRMTLTLEPRDTGAQWFGDWDGFRDFGRSFVIPAPPTPPATPEAPHPPSPPLPPKFFEFDELLGRSSGRLGVTVDDLSSQLAEYFGTKDGVLVTSVTEGSVASKAGLKAGDVITSVNGTDVTSPADLRRRLGRFGDSEEFTLGIVRDRKPMTLKGKLEAGSRRRLTYTVL
jgi:serine protease Do